MDSLFSNVGPSSRWHQGDRYDSVPTVVQDESDVVDQPKYIMMRRRKKFVSVSAKLADGAKVSEIQAESKHKAKVQRRREQRQHMMQQMEEAQQMKMMQQMSNMANGGGGGVIGGCFKAGENEACKIVAMICCACCCIGACIAFFALCAKKLCGCLTDLCGSCLDPFKSLFGGIGDIFSAPFKGIGGLFGKRSAGTIGGGTKTKLGTHPLRQFTTLQTHSASIPANWRFVVAFLPIFATGILLLMSYQIGDTNPAAVASEKEFCQQLRLSIDFGTTKMFDGAIDALLPGCYTSKMDVLENSYHYSCIDFYGRPKYSDTEMRDTILAGIRWASLWDESTDVTNITSSLILSATCNSTSGDGYYTLDGTHLQIAEACRYIHILSEVSGEAEASLLHDLHELHIPGCKGNHPVVLSRTFEENCLPSIPL